ncbi:ABC-type transport system, involved in lipoprotein release, permease component [Gottschalkia purinilytica]|uniref:ABC-type transport system, involved in lipoprotein release, permease component n=1 Tax=Gottschalkia purinilytica TaxID=1503 RepID=A0A0L0WDS7_GOTPU|nr:ABC transporter permease [Gottschalkia purinilytica]KNF09596.1 ABC-type transport system, involved in lipoprotein release, permease component [Gottschalkia purinilytica]
MTLSNMAVKNIRGNLYRYIMYYLSNTFTVTVFFLFANFIFHPSEITNVKRLGNGNAQQGVTNALIMCQFIIVIFTILFVAYSVSIFLKSRGKEFGLLSLFGMTKNQIRKYIMVESTIISFVSIVSGIILGSGLSRLFFIIIGKFLENNIPFSISFKAIGLTFAIFFVLFEVINMIMLFKIKGKEIVEQIKSNRIPKEVPKFSKTKSIIGVILLAIGYGIAWISRGTLVVLVMIPVIVIVTIGTYFIFTQFSIAVTNGLKKNNSRFYTKTNMVALSQMIFKLKDTAKVLFLASILGAVTFTATETVYSLFTEITNGVTEGTPNDIGIVELKKNTNDKIDIKEVKSILEKHNLDVKYLNNIEGIEAKIANKENEDKNDPNTVDFNIISNSQYNKLAKQSDEKQVKVNKDEIVYIFSSKPVKGFNEDEMLEKEKRLKEEGINLDINSNVKKYEVKETLYGKPINGSYLEDNKILVMNDDEFNKILKDIPKEKLFKYYGIQLNNWEDSYKASKEIGQFLGKDYEGYYSNKIEPYTAQKNAFGMILFIGFFIAFLFFIASGSIIYFKLFNDMKQDSVEYSILKKVGSSKNDIRKIITKQIGVIFFLPFIISTVHSLFALKSLANLLNSNLLTNGLIVMTGYFVFQLIYFLIIKSIYIRKIETL